MKLSTSLNYKTLLINRVLLKVAVHPLNQRESRVPVCRLPSQNTIVVEAGGQQGEGEGAKLDAGPAVELILKLHPGNREHILTTGGRDSVTSSLGWSASVLPVEAEGVKKGGQAFHHHEDGHGEDSEEAKHGHQEQDAHHRVHAEADVHHHGPQHLGELCERRETSVRHVHVNTR